MVNFNCTVCDLRIESQLLNSNISEPNSSQEESGKWDGIIIGWRRVPGREALLRSAPNKSSSGGVGGK